jgi:hypothetical protein
MNSEKPVKTGKKQGNRFKPGQSGNPKGRPKGSISITESIRKKLMEHPPGQRKTYLTFLIIRIFDLAIKEGDTTMIKQIWAYIDGMPIQSIDAPNLMDNFAAIVKAVREKENGGEK